MSPATAMRAVLLVTVLCWTVQPPLSHHAALCQASESGVSEIDEEFDWERLEVTCFFTSAVDFSVELPSAHTAETVTLPSEVDVCCLEHLRGPPSA